MFQQYLDAFLNSINSFTGLKRVNTTNKASGIYNLGKAFVSYSMEILGAVNASFDRLDPDMATGSDLEAIADNYDLSRNYGTPSEGYVLLWMYSPPSTKVIPIGTQVSTEDGVSFTLTVDAIIPHDMTLYPEVDVYHPQHPSNTYGRFYALPLRDGVSYDNTIPLKDQVEWTDRIKVEAIEVGRHTNIDAYEITEVGYNLGGTNTITDEEESGVMNDAPFSGGSDEEDDDTFRIRIKSHLAGTSSTTAKALAAEALFPGIDDARVLEPDDPKAGLTPPFGSVYMVVASARSRYTPEWAANEEEVPYVVSYPTTLKEEIRNYLEDYRSVGVNVVLKEAKVVSMNIVDENDSAEPVIIYVKPGTNILIYTNIIDALLKEFFETRKIGQDIYKSDVISLLLTVDNIVDIAPFELKSTRYEDGTYYSLLGTESGAAEGRDGIIIYAEEIARPDRDAMNFKLVHDTQVR